MVQVEAEVSEAREEVRRTRDRTPSLRQRSVSPDSQERYESPAQSPLTSLPSNTAQVLQARGNPTAARRVEQYWNAPSADRYEPIITSVPSNTADILAARERDQAHSAAERKNSAELAAFASGFLLSKRG